MSNNDNFGSGFILGTIVGGIVGGVLGNIIANKTREIAEGENSGSVMKNISYTEAESDNFQNTRVNLEDKINQLNHAIDEVRFTLLKNTEAEMSEK